MKENKILKTASMCLGCVLIGMFFCHFMFKKHTLVIQEPANTQTIDRLVESRVEAYKDSMYVVFDSENKYKEYLDSLKKANVQIVTIPVEKVVQVTVDSTRIDTVYQRIEVPGNCIPEQIGTTFNRSFEFEFDVSHTSEKARVKGLYSQPDWALHPDGTFKGIEVYTPPHTIIKEVYIKQNIFQRHGDKLIFAGLGYLAGRL